MKPRFIFSAVAAMCFIMVMTLPRLAMSTASASAPVIETPALLATEEALPVLPIALSTEPPVIETEVPVVDGIPVEAVAAVTEPQPTEAAVEAAGDAAGDAQVEAAIPAAAPPPAEAAQAPIAQGELPTLEEFAAGLVNGQAQAVVGYYAPGLSALPVRQQPFGDGDYISDEYGTVTQYGKPAGYGVIGLLAHNTLSGREFFYLGQNQDVFLVYGDGRTQRYRITRIHEYQALSPYDTRSDFVDLSNPGGPLLTHSEVFQRVYTQNGTLVLQTCIEANGEPTWGRLFVIAEPL